MRTHALCSRRPGDEPTPAEIDLSAVRDDELLVRIVASGVCHSDVKAAAGKFYLEHPQGAFHRVTPLTPAVAGHEGSGVVVRAGARAIDFQEGDHVRPEHAPC